MDLNIASVYVDPLPGAIRTTRTVTNVTDQRQSFRVSATAPDGVRIRVTPSSFSIDPGDSLELSIVIDALEAPEGWNEGRIAIDPSRQGLDNVEIPVMVNVADAEITLAQSCDPASIRWLGYTTCTVAATNFLPVEVEASIDVASSPMLYMSTVRSPARRTWTGATWSGTLAQAEPPTIEGVNAIDPLLTPGGGYLPLAIFGVNPTVVPDEGIVDFNVPAFTFGSEVYDRIGVVSNGYIVVGDSSASDVNYQPIGFPGEEAPNNVLAPYWTDLNPEFGEVRVGLLTGATASYLVVEYDVPTYSGNATNQFQIWITVGATEEIYFVYGDIGGGDAATTLATGAENRSGTSAVLLEEAPTTGQAYQVLTGPPSAGGTVEFSYRLTGLMPGTWPTVATLRSPQLRATPAVQTLVRVG